MTTDLVYLALTAILTASLWLAYIVAQVITNRFLTPANYADPTPCPLPRWGKRAGLRDTGMVESAADLNAPNSGRGYCTRWTRGAGAAPSISSR